MFDSLKKMINLPKSIKQLLSVNSDEFETYQYLNKIQKKSKLSTEVVLVQSVEDAYYFAVFGLITSSLAKYKAIQVDQLVFNSLALGESKTLTKFIKSRFVNRLLRNKWVGLYKVFCANVAYRCVGFQAPINDIVSFCRAYSLWRAMTTKEDLAALEIDGVLVGDLINDSFLRFKPAPTVKIKDVYLLITIWQSYRDVTRAKKYFTRVKPKLYLTSYSTYIQHGIATRVALINGVRVFSFGNYQEFAKELSLTDWFQTKNTDSYAKEFAGLTDFETKLALSEAALNARISGVIDNATAYMRQSAYSETNEIVPYVKGAVVVFLHDFYDSPHIYPSMVFPDFWEWICFTIDTLNNANINFVIKPHPNQINLSDSVLVELKKWYPSITLISSKITNKQLVDAGMACAVTVYGTVAHEMAYMGIPTIASAHHPHISFEFCKTATNKSEYAEFLKDFNKSNLSASEMKRQSLIFYYMHNLNLSYDEKRLMNALSKLRQYYDNVGSKQVENQTDLIDEISKCPAFSAFISRLI